MTKSWFLLAVVLAKLGLIWAQQGPPDFLRSSPGPTWWSTAKLCRCRLRVRIFASGSPWNQVGTFSPCLI